MVSDAIIERSVENKTLHSVDGLFVPVPHHFYVRVKARAHRKEPSKEHKEVFGI
jgi:hypothetical protein